MLERIKSLLVVMGAVAVAFGLYGCGQEDSSDSADMMAAAGGNGSLGGSGGGLPTGGSGGSGGDAGGAGGSGGDAGGAGGGGGAGAAGGAGGGGGAGAAGGAGGEGGSVACDVALQLRDNCDPAADCCDRGLACVDLEEGVSQCLRTCDANAEVNRCGERELCNPADGNIPADQPSPGICLPGDDCQPGLEDLVCGDEPATCLFASPASFCWGAGERGVGEDCTFDPMAPADACQAGLVCVVGQCHPPCGEDDACPEGRRCVNYSDRLDGLDAKFCYAGCDVYNQVGCEAGEACVMATNDSTGSAMGFCDGTSMQGEAVHGEMCVSADDNYWGSCNAGHYCDPFGDGGPCAGFCDPNNQSLCTANSVCRLGLFREPLQLGLCLGECSAWGAEGKQEAGQCGEGQYCNFAFIGRGADDEQDTISGLCLDGDQSLTTGEQCEADMETGASNCEAGNFCATLVQGSPPECVKLCDTYQDSGHGCPAGLNCATGLFGADGDENQFIGICR